MNIRPEFPPHRRKDSGRSTEVGVHDQLAGSGLPSHAVHELKPLPEGPKLDFAAWIEGVGRFGIEVKGGGVLGSRGALERSGPPRDRAYALHVHHTRAKAGKRPGFQGFHHPGAPVVRMSWTCSRRNGPQSVGQGLRRALRRRELPAGLVPADGD